VSVLGRATLLTNCVSRIGSYLHAE